MFIRSREGWKGTTGQEISKYKDTVASKSLVGLGDDKKLGMGKKDKGDTARHTGSDQIRKAGWARDWDLG